MSKYNSMLQDFLIYKDKAAEESAPPAPAVAVPAVAVPAPPLPTPRPMLAATRKRPSMLTPPSTHGGEPSGRRWISYSEGEEDEDPIDYRRRVEYDLRKKFQDWQ